MTMEERDRQFKQAAMVNTRECRSDMPLCISLQALQTLETRFPALGLFGC